MKSNESMLCYSFNPTLTLPFDARQRWSQKCSGCDHTFDISQKWSQIRPLHFYNTFEWCQGWEQICNELLLQTLMSKLILRKEIKKLYLNTVLKIFIRQYRTQAGNHGNCCFIVIFENVLEYLLFEVFFVLSWVDHFPFDLSIYDVMIATQNNDSTIGRWKTEPKQDTLFLARNCRGCKLSPPAQTNKLRRSKENKSCFFVRSSPAFVNKYFHLLYLW